MPGTEAGFAALDWIQNSCRGQRPHHVLLDSVDGIETAKIMLYGLQTGVGKGQFLQRDGL